MGVTLENTRALVEDVGVLNGQEVRDVVLCVCVVCVCVVCVSVSVCVCVICPLVCVLYLRCCGCDCIHGLVHSQKYVLVLIFTFTSPSSSQHHIYHYIAGVPADALPGCTPHERLREYRTGHVRFQPNSAHSTANLLPSPSGLPQRQCE